MTSSFDPADYTSWWTILFFLLLWIVVGLFRICILRGCILPKFTRNKFLDLWERRKRNVLTYMVFTLGTTTALIFQVYGGWHILFQNYSKAAMINSNNGDSNISETDIQWSTFSIQLCCILYVWEVVYRERIGWPLLVHHGLTFVFLQLLVVAYIMEDQSILYLRLALFVAFFATTNQLSYISLFCFRLKVLNPKIQRSLFWISTVQMFLVKAALTGGCAGYYFILIFSMENNDEAGDYITFRDDTRWGNFWRYMFLPILFHTFVAHFYVCQLLLTLSQRQMTIIRPGMSVEALERMQREYRLAFLTLEAYENTPSSSSSSSAWNAVHNDRRHYQTLLGSHHYFSNNYYYSSRKMGGGGDGVTSRNFGFYGADQDMPTTWNEIMSSAIPASRVDDDRLYFQQQQAYASQQQLQQAMPREQARSSGRPYFVDGGGGDRHDDPDEYSFLEEDHPRHMMMMDQDVDTTRTDDSHSHSNSNSPYYAQQQQAEQPRTHILGAMDVRRLFGSNTSRGVSRTDSSSAVVQEDADYVFHNSFQQAAAAAAWTSSSSPPRSHKSSSSSSSGRSPSSSLSSSPASRRSIPEEPAHDEYEDEYGDEAVEEEQVEAVLEVKPQEEEMVAAVPSNSTNNVRIRGSFLLSTSHAHYRHQPPLEDVPEEGHSMSKSSSSNNSSLMQQHSPQDQQPQPVQSMPEDDDDDDLYAQSSPSSSSSSYVEPPPVLQREQKGDLPFMVINVKSKNRGASSKASSDGNSTSLPSVAEEGSQDQHEHENDDHHHHHAESQGFENVVILDEPQFGAPAAAPPDGTSRSYTRLEPMVEESSRSVGVGSVGELPPHHHSVLPAYSEHLDLEANSSSLVEAPTTDTFELPGEDYDVYQMRT